jgi:hypothetical protein
LLLSGVVAHFCSTSTLSMSTGSKGGLPPLLQSRVA